MKQRVLVPFACLAVACVVLVLWGPGCRKKGGQASLTGLLPADAAIVLIFPDLSATITDVNALVKKFAVGPAAAFLNQGKIELARQLGFDPLKPDEWKKIGVDPKKGMAVLMEPARTVVALGLSDAKAFEKEVQRRLKELTGADQVSTTKVDGISVTSIGFKMAEGSVAHLHYAIVSDHALVTGMAGDLKLLATCAKLKAEQALSGADWFKGLARKIPSDSDVQLYVNGPEANRKIGRAEERIGFRFQGGMVAALSISAGGLALNSFAATDDRSAKWLAGFASDAPDAHLERYLPADTLVALKVRLRPHVILDSALKSDPRAREEYERMMALAKETLGQDVEAATVKNLTGNGALGISLGKPEQINKLIGARAPGDVGGAFRLTLWGQLKDGELFGRLLTGTVNKTGDQLPAKSGKVGSVSVLTFPGRMGVQIHVMHTRDLLGMCLGEGCVETAAALVEGKGEALAAKLSKPARKLFSEPSLAAGTLNFGQVVDAVAGLDAGNMGQGGMMVKMALDLAVGAIKNLRELTGIVRIEADGLSIQGHLRIQ